VCVEYCCIIVINDEYIYVFVTRLLYSSRNLCKKRVGMQVECVVLGRILLCATLVCVCVCACMCVCVCV